MKTEYNNDRTAVKIWGDFSPHPVIVTTKAVTELGGIERAYHEIKRLHSQDLLARTGGESNPIDLRALELTRENENLGHRHWRWGSFQVGREILWGYHWREGENLVHFIDGSTIQIQI